MKNRFISHIEGSIRVNQIIYFLRKIPFIRNIIHENMYHNEQLKETYRILITIFRIIFRILRKVLSTFFLIFISLAAVRFSDFNLQFVHVFLGIACSFNLMATTDSLIFQDRNIKWILTAIFKMDPRAYYHAQFQHQLIDRALYGIILTLGLFLSIQNQPQYSSYLILSLSFPTINFILAEALTMHVFKRHARQIRVRTRLLTILALLLAGFAIAFTPELPVWTPLIIFAILLMMVLRAYHIVQEFDDFAFANRITRTAMNLSTDVSQQVLELSKKELRIDDTVDREASLVMVKKRAGYNLLNALFFERHRRIWYKPIRNIGRIIMVVGFVVTLTFLYFKRFELQFFDTLHEFFNATILDSLGLLVFFTYAINSSQRITRAFYLNADYSLLHYAFYRRKETIWKQYLVRLRNIIVINFIPVAMVLLWFAVWGALGYFTLSNALWIIVLDFIALSVFFSTYHLFLYYMLQPFNRNMETKSPAYMAANFVVVMVAYNQSILRAIPHIKTGIIVLSVVFILASTLIVRLYSYKTFKVRT